MREETTQMMPTGDCFEAAGSFITRREVIDNPQDYRLVHGNVARLRQDERVNHAWIEEGDDLVHELSGGQRGIYAKKDYYERLRINNVRLYTVEEALMQLNRNGHWGPWD